MEDEKGCDEKLLAVPIADPRFNGIRDVEDLEPHWPREIENFFLVYKNLESGKETKIEVWKNAAEAKNMLDSIGKSRSPSTNLPLPVGACHGVVNPKRIHRSFEQHNRFLISLRVISGKVIVLLAMEFARNRPQG